MLPTQAFNQEQCWAEHAIRRFEMPDAAFRDPAISKAIGWCFLDHLTQMDVIGTERHIRTAFGFGTCFDPVSRHFDRGLQGLASLDVGGDPVPPARLLVEVPRASPSPILRSGRGRGCSDGMAWARLPVGFSPIPAGSPANGLRRQPALGERIAGGGHRRLHRPAEPLRAGPRRGLVRHRDPHVPRRSDARGDRRSSSSLRLRGRDGRPRHRVRRPGGRVPGHDAR